MSYKAYLNDNMIILPEQPDEIATKIRECENPGALMSNLRPPDEAREILVTN